MLLLRALVSCAMAAYVVAVPTGGLAAVARVWMWYAGVDGVAALLSIAILPPGYARGTSLRLQAIWSIGAAVIGMRVRQQDRVEMSHTKRQRLLSQVRPGIDEDARVRRHVEIDRRTQALVSRIGGPADGAVAGDHRHAV